MRNRRFITAGRGIRLHAVPLSGQDTTVDPYAEMVRPYTRVTDRTAASHLTAARLWHFPLPGWAESVEQIHISRELGTSLPRRKGVIGHLSRILPTEVVCIDGTYITNRRRTWLDLAELLDLDDVVVVADHLLRIPRPHFEGREVAYATIQDLEEVVALHPGKKGVTRARKSLGLSRVGADSAPETKLRLAIVRAGLPLPDVNEAILDSSGLSIHESDLSFRAFRIAIEYEGAGHSDPRQVERDIARAERVEAAGWLEVRVSRRHMVDDAWPALDKIRTALMSRGWSPA